MTRRTEPVTEADRPAGRELAPLPLDGPLPGGLARGYVKPWDPALGHDPEEAPRRTVGGIGLYLHAFRRRWPLAISVGLACGCAAMIAAWFVATDRYTAVALLKISANEQQLVFQTVERASNSSFEIYKGTQQQMLTSDLVLTAALRNPETAKLAALQTEDDPVRWLARNLRVEFPNNAEILRVSLTTSKPEEAEALVNAVVDAYMAEVVDAERHRQERRLKDLDRLYDEKELEMRNGRTELKQLAEQLGTGDTGALALKQQIILQQYAESRNELSRLRTELQRARDDLQIKQAWIKALETGTQPAPDLETLAATDPVLARLSEQIEEIDKRLTSVWQKVSEKLYFKISADDLQLRKSLVEKQAKRRAELVAKLPKISRTNLDPQIAELKVRIDILAAQEKAAVEDLDKQRQKAEQVGNSSIEVEMKRSELVYLDKVLAPIADEREKLKVELSPMTSKPRISVVQPADVPKSRDGRPRVQTAAVAGMGGFFGVILLVLVWDVRKQRINSLVDLSRGLGLNVIGTIPLLPQKALCAGRTGKRHRKSQNSLNHAVDAIAARLFLRKDAEGVRVVMVSSATQGEGKTLLAVQLAKRLARTGERTLLVDYDLRRPAIHRIFAMPRGPGVSECLEMNVDLNQVAQPTDIDNLFVITAGKPLVDSLGLLSNGVTTSFFDHAREAFSFVVIDGCPILPVVDGLLVSQHADTVVLSVRRDTSEAPQVLRACEKLAAFGSRKYVVVLNGSHEEVYGDYQDAIINARVEATAPAEAGKT